MVALSLRSNRFQAALAMFVVAFLFVVQLPVGSAQEGDAAPTTTAMPEFDLSGLEYNDKDIKALMAENPEATAGIFAAFGAMAGVFIVVYLAIVVLMLVAGWKIYTKAGKPGWAVLIPIYNIIVYLDIVGKPWWWLLLMLIPLVNIVIGIMIMHQLSLAFGKGAGYTVGLILLPIIFFPMLAFGSAKYTKPVAAL